MRVCISFCYWLSQVVPTTTLPVLMPISASQNLTPQ
jgi:hypothetical protein